MGECDIAPQLATKGVHSGLVHTMTQRLRALFSVVSYLLSFIARFSLFLNFLSMFPRRSNLNFPWQGMKRLAAFIMDGHEELEGENQASGPTRGIMVATPSLVATL